MVILGACLIFLRHQPIDISAVGGVKRQTYLHLVCGRKGSQALNVLKELLKFNVSSRARLVTDSDKNIPLFVAIEARNLAICQELLTHFTEEQLKYTKVCIICPLTLGSFKNTLHCCLIYRHVVLYDVYVPCLVIGNIE